MEDNEGQISKSGISSIAKLAAPPPRMIYRQAIVVTGETATAIFSSPIWMHGPPLVFKADSGSYFFPRGAGDLLAARVMPHLHSPGVTRQYMGLTRRPAAPARRPLAIRLPWSVIRTAGRRILPAPQHDPQSLGPSLGTSHADARRRLEALQHHLGPAQPATNDRQSLPTEGEYEKKNSRRGCSGQRCPSLCRPCRHQPSA